jgi:hypothetical protein
VQIRPVTFEELFKDASHLIVAHHQEADPGEPLAVNYDLFSVIERAGALLTLGLFTDADEWAGYVIASVAAHPYKAVIVTSVSGLYVKAEHRGDNNCRKLMDALRDESARRGAKRVYWHGRIGSDFERILDKRCTALETVFEETV